jgi:hypothetical protein
VKDINRRLPEFQRATWGFAPGQTGDVVSTIRNPLHISVIPSGLDLEEQAEYVRDLSTHFVPRAQGGEALAPGANVWYFTGRRRALEAICTWLGAKPPAPNLLVAVGRPGAGKSALLGRLVTLADPQFREKILSAGSLPPQAVPPVRAFHTAIHLRERRVREVADLLVEALGLPPLSNRLRDDELGTLLVQSLAERKAPCCPLFDALDEAVSPTDMWRLLLRPLASAPNVKVIIGSRPLFDFGTAVKVDLSAPFYLEDTPLREYVARRLLAELEPQKWTPYRGNSELANKIAQAVAARADGVFLVARLVSRLLLEGSQPLDTSVPDWQSNIPGTVGEAFGEYLDRFGLDAPRVRDILLPLAFARGQGYRGNRSGRPWHRRCRGASMVTQILRRSLRKPVPF